MHINTHRSPHSRPPPPLGDEQHLLIRPSVPAPGVAAGFLLAALPQCHLVCFSVSHYLNLEWQSGFFFAEDLPSHQPGTSGFNLHRWLRKWCCAIFPACRDRPCDPGHDLTWWVLFILRKYNWLCGIGLLGFLSLLSHVILFFPLF